MAPPSIRTISFLDIQNILILALIFILTGLFLKFLWKNQRKLILSWKYPGPFNLPFIGSAYVLMRQPDDIYSGIMKVQKNYPNGCKLWFGRILIYVLTQPEHIEKILGSPRCVHKGEFYNFAIEFIGEGLLPARLSIWKRHRKILMPSFNQKILDSFVEIFAEKSTIFSEFLEENCNRKDLNWYNLLCRCTLDTTCASIMGLKLDIQRQDNENYGYHFEQLFYLATIRMLHLWNHFNFIWKLFGYEKRQKNVKKALTDLIDKVIIEKKKSKETLETNPTINLENPKTADRKILLDYLIETNQLDDEELRNEINMFIVAGTETTASAMNFILVILAMFPDIEQKVYEEIMSVLGPNRLPNYNDLPYLQYTERVIKETLRIFPVAALFVRTTIEDVDIGDTVIPSDSTIVFATVFMHRNEKYWKDPLKFDPDRFLPEESAKRHPCSYIPFSYGPRNCIGLKYAMMNMKVMISILIRKFHFHCRFERIEDIRIKSHIVLRFKDDPEIYVTKRENKIH